VARRGKLARRRRLRKDRERAKADKDPKQRSKRRKGPQHDPHERIVDAESAEGFTEGLEPSERYPRSRSGRARA
jgi:hypothetical protein